MFQDPFSSCNPIFKADRVFGHDPATPSSRGRAETSGAGAWRPRCERQPGPGRRARQVSRTSSPAASCSACSSRARCCWTSVPGRGRDHQHARRLDPDGRPQPPGRLQVRGLGVLFVTHDLSLGNYISDQAIILRRGRIVERGPTSTCSSDRRTPTRRCCWRRCRRSTTGLGGEALARVGSQRTRKVRASITSTTRAGMPRRHASEANPTMVEVSPGHLVTCASVDEPGGCLQGAPGSRPPDGRAAPQRSTTTLANDEGAIRHGRAGTAHVSGRLPVGGRDELLPDRGRGGRGRAGAQHLGHARAMRPGAIARRRHRRRRRRPLPPLSRGRRAHALDWA